MISKLIVRGLVLASALLLGACGTMSPYSAGYIVAPPEAKKVIDDGGWSEEAAAQIAIVCNPDFNGGKCSPKAVKKILQYAMSCQQQIDTQLAGPGQSAAGGAVAYGAAGLGTGVAAQAAFKGPGSVLLRPYAVYGALAYILPGAVNGLVSGSYSMAAAKGDCTRQFWEDISKTDPDFRGTHVTIVYAGKTGSSVPPALSPVTAPSPKSPLAR